MPKSKPKRAGVGGKGEAFEMRCDRSWHWSINTRHEWITNRKSYPSKSAATRAMRAAASKLGIVLKETP